MSVGAAIRVHGFPAEASLSWRKTRPPPFSLVNSASLQIGP